MLINKQILSDLNPCSERFDNYLEYYDNFEGTFEQFIDLENVSYEDKIWVAQRLLNKNQLITFAVLIAESVVHIYEDKYPNDSRIRDLVNFMKTVENFDEMSSEQQIKLAELKAAAYAAVYAAVDAAAAYAAVDAAAAYAAKAAYYAANAAKAAYYAANAAYAASGKQQQDLNLQFLKMAASL